MKLPIAVAIDVEPDPRLVYAPDPAHWAGFEATVPFVEEMRAQLAARTGHEATFTWLLRMDDQMERAYGRRDWIAERYGDRLDAFLAAGDDVGLHTHLYRWNDATGEWFTDMHDLDFGVGCFHRALAAFRARFGRDAEVHSFGDRWLTEEAIDAMDAEGVLLEFTPEPGLAPRNRFRVDEVQRGALNDYRDAPRHLWSPAAGDYLRHDASSPRRLRIQPVATYRFPMLFEAGRLVDLTRRRLRGDVPSEDDRFQRTVRACLGQRAYVVQHAMRDLLGTHAPGTLHFVMRASQFASPAWRARAKANLLWLAGGGLGRGRDAVFASGTRLLAMVDDGRASVHGHRGDAPVPLPAAASVAGSARP